MTLSIRQQQALMAPLNPARIATRKQGNTNLSYLEAWDIKAALIRMFGFGGFSAEALQCDIVRIENNIPRPNWVNRKREGNLPIEYDPDGQIAAGTANFRVTARVQVRLTIHSLGAVYTEWAASSQTGPDLGEVTDFAIKTAESDALKRAAIYLGTQFGLSLYDNGSTQDVVRVVLTEDQAWGPQGPMRNQGQAAQNQGQEPSGGAEGTPGPSEASQAVQEATGVPERTEDELAKAQRFVENAFRAKRGEGYDPAMDESAMAGAAADDMPDAPGESGEQ